MGSDRVEERPVSFMGMIKQRKISNRGKAGAALQRVTDGYHPHPQYLKHTAFPATVVREPHLVPASEFQASRVGKVDPGLCAG